MSNPIPPSEKPTDGASLPISKSPDKKKLDPAYYTWSNTFSIMMNRMTGNRDAELERNYFEEQDLINEEAYCKRCESNRDYLLKYSPIITFLSSEIAKLTPTSSLLPPTKENPSGSPLNSTNIICRMCSAFQSGGFHIDHGILLCANQFRNRGHQEDTMAHEMVHAWDHLKWKVEDDNLKHQACLEIRASTLSGECRFAREFFTKNQWRITEQLQTCVRRRATLSLMQRPGVKDDVQAARIVNEVWESCFNDTRPFDEIYR